MKKRDFNLVGNEGTDNQELAKGIAFVKSRRAELNVVQMVESMRDQAIPNGVIINDAYCDRSMTRDYDREALNAFFATLKEEDFEVVVVRSLNEITDDIYDLEEFVKTITDMGQHHPAWELAARFSISETSMRAGLRRCIPCARRRK